MTLTTMQPSAAQKVEVCCLWTSYKAEVFYSKQARLTDDQNTESIRRDVYLQK